MLNLYFQPLFHISSYGILILCYYVSLANHCHKSKFKKIMKRKSGISNVAVFIKYILLIRLLQSSHFPPLFLYALHIPSYPHPLPLSSCPWVVHISSLASTFPILLLTFPCLFSTYHLCYLFPVPFPPFPPLPPHWLPP